MSTTLKFVSGAETLQFDDGASYPASRPIEKMQVQDRTAAGTLHVEDFGVTIQTRVLVFELMSFNDYSALIDWFLNISNGSEKKFDFTDEYGNFFPSVRILDTSIDFTETSLQRYSGTITLEI